MILEQYKCCQFEDCKLRVRQEIMAGNDRNVKHGDSKDRKGNARHGDAYIRLYEIYQKMKRRCYSSKDAQYFRWGGRGITICEEWLNKETGYSTFKTWALANGYANDLTIDRIDNDGNYEPGNCRWVTIKEQSWNRRSTVWVEFKGQTLPLTVALKEAEIGYGAYKERIKRGWTVQEALETPPHTYPKRIGPGYKTQP